MFFLILALIAAFIGGIAAMGRWAAATHPTPQRPSGQPGLVVPLAPVAAGPEEVFAAGVQGVPAESMAAIAAAVTTVCGPRIRIARIEPAATRPASKPASVETLMLQWSMEGRRQIYSSHRVR
jgi:hypothetical protein